jgi:hypothetical protein
MAVRRVASHRRKYFTPEEDALILAHYAEEGAIGLAARLKRRPQTICDRASRLGVSCNADATQKRRVAGYHKTREATSAHLALAALAPTYLKKYEPFSHKWYRAQQLAFADAMKNNPTERPS